MTLLTRNLPPLARVVSTLLNFFETNNDKKLFSILLRMHVDSRNVRNLSKLLFSSKLFARLALCFKYNTV